MSDKPQAVIRLQGGLGNQMFQYAFGLALAAKGSAEVLFDGAKYSQSEAQRKKSDKRAYELKYFKADVRFAPESQLKNWVKKKEKNFFKKFFHFVMGKSRPALFEEKDCSVFYPEFFNICKDSYYTGYFQTEKYFRDKRNAVLQAFSLKNPVNSENAAMLDKIKGVNAVSLHVRRGDYLLAKNQALLGLCSLDYYKKAIDYIASRVENPHFFLFSDDIPWVEENLKLDYPYTVVDINSGENSFYDMWLMKHCRHNIIANSSFSWWGAWLNENPEKIVAAPEKWTVAAEISGKDIIPESWIKL